MATKEYFFVMGLFWQKAGFCTGPRLYVVVFTVDDVLWPVVYHRRWQTVYWCEHWQQRVYSCWGTAWRWVMIQSGNVLYTYTKRFACFCWVSVFLMASRVFAESVFLLSQVRFCRVSFCWVSYLLTRLVIAESDLLSQFFTDKATWFSAETYFIRIINVKNLTV